MWVTILLVISTVFAIYLWWIEQKRVSMEKLISDIDT
ncbi:hypothetical protein NIES806_08100 [Dolichospermum compactum NIES-806]|uniref:Uncharacterized protein n=1 Tax=Dolichospermum compactum NIES-806 TaxID=1973481 RepID=A0A1Z4UZE2_9CYAN|nr:hypothetical protein NIES806_08100 [Dolichospermum compactum NIES-806]